MNEPVALIGFMGAGKSSVGPFLAMHLGLDFVDLDDEIVRRSGLSIDELFARKGEDEFRRLETELLREALRGEPRVVATGGGVVERLSNRRDLVDASVNLWLDTRFETVRERLESEDSEGRPLVRRLGWDGLRALHRRRRPLYASCAHFRFDADRGMSARLARRIALVLRSWDDEK